MSGIFDQIINYSPPLIVSGTVNYKGTWNASTNNPTLNNPPATSTKGDYYVVSTAGTQFSISFAVGDWIISSGTAWEKVDLTDAVSSVFGRTGAVVGVSTDYSAVGITNTAIGASSPSTGAFTTVSASTPIAVVSGGTGVSTSTGTTNVVLSNSPTIVTPVIAQINDANGNETLKLASIASAVNEVTIENAATGNAVHITATGTDASVGLHLAAKGASGYVNVQDSVDATKRIMFNAAGGTTNTRTMLSSTQTVDRTISLPDATDTLVGKATTDTLTNKTLTSPTLTTPILGTPSSGTLTSCTGLPISTGVSGLGTGIATALAVNTGSAGAPVLFNGALGTPTSGTVTNLTGTASININGTVGATTASTGAFTTLSATGNISSGVGLSGSSGRHVVDMLQGGYSVPGDYNTAANGDKFIAYLGDSYDARIGIGTSADMWFKSAGNAAASFGFYTGATTLTKRVDISSTGLAVTGQVDATSTFRAVAGGGGVSQLNFVGNTGNLNAQIQYDQVAANTGQIFIGTNNSGTFATRLTITSTGLAVTGALSSTTGANFATSSGNVGIGTASPAAKLHITGDANTRIQIDATSTQGFYFTKAGTNNGTFRVDTDGNFEFYTKTVSQAMVLTAAGNVGIGTTSPGAKLEAYGDFLCGTQTAGSLPSASNTGFYFANPYNVSAARWSGGSYTGALTLVNIYNGNGVVGSISTLASATLYNTTSDYRLKNVTGELTGSGEFIDSLKPKVGTWKSDGGKFVGFLAHEFAEVSPLSVNGEKDAVDEEGKPKYQSMQASSAEVIANLVAELQSVRQRLAALESK